VASLCPNSDCPHTLRHALDRKRVGQKEILTERDLDEKEIWREREVERELDRNVVSGG